MAQTVRESACGAGDPGSLPGQEDPPEEGRATHSSIQAWRIPWAEEPGGLSSKRSPRVGHDRATNALMVLVIALSWYFSS